MRRVGTLAAVFLCAGVLVGGALTRATANYDIRAGDRVFANDVGIFCTDQLQTALRATRQYTPVVGRYALVCSTGGGLRRGYTVRISELGVVVIHDRQTVFSRRVP